MCLGENSANHSVHYVNAQLTALWENSVECTEHAGKNLNPLERIRYDFALREFHVASKQRSKTTGELEPMFSAVFDKPRLDFVCNHEAVLYLKIKEGHFNRDFAKIDDLTFAPTRSRNVPLKDLELAFRLDFVTNTFKGTTADIGNGAHIIQLVVLNIASATLASKVEIADAKEALAFYMKKYLEFLRQAGHHVVFSLPDFDDDGQQVQIDYSLIPHFIRSMEYDITEIFGIHINTINDNLSSRWLQSIMATEDEGTPSKEAVCLAEYRSTWTTIGDRKDIQFWIKFGAPKVKILCKREAIFTFVVEELLVFDGSDFTVAPKFTYKDWEIATVVDVVKKGPVTQVEFDFKSLRVCETLSIFTALDISITWAATLKATIFEFFQLHYTTVLEKISVHVIKNDYMIIPAPRPIPLPSPDREPSIKETVVADYDFLQVISVAGIVEHFKTLWQSYQGRTEDYAKLLINWSYGEEITTSFGAITFRLLSEDRAMIWVRLANGSLKPLKGDTRREFSEWSIAFEVKLTLTAHEEVVRKSSSWFSRFKESLAWKLHGDQKSRTLQHLGIDFSSAKFVYDKSSFEGLALGTHAATGYIRAVVQYLTKYYFEELTVHGHHILYTVPVWKSGFNPPSWGLTSLSFQIYSQYTYTRETVYSSNAVLILLGMTCFREHPKRPLPYSGEWVFENSAGTVCLSRQVFFEQHLLKTLAAVNGTSTIVPNFCPGGAAATAAIFTGAEESEWGLALATWAERTCTRKTTAKSDWKVNPNKSESDYIWQYSDKWSYEHENSIDASRNGVYKVSCVTKNLLSFPEAHDGSLDIVLKGIVDVDLTFKGNKNWATHMQSQWASSVSIKSSPGGSGLSIEVIGDTQPPFKTISTDIPIEQLFDVKALHSLLHIELSTLASELRQSFGGVWEYCFVGTGALSLCNPIFNKNGDILFELRPYVPLTQTQIVSRPSVGRVESKKQSSFLRRIGETIVDVLDDSKIGQSIKSNGSVTSSSKSEKVTSQILTTSTPIKIEKGTSQIQISSPYIGGEIFPPVKTEKGPGQVEIAPTRIGTEIVPPVKNEKGTGQIDIAPTRISTVVPLSKTEVISDPPASKTDIINYARVVKAGSTDVGSTPVA